MSRIAGFTVALILVATGVFAQEWRGPGRLMGTVVDEQGKGLEGVIVHASLPAYHGILAESKSNKKGEWTIDDVGEGGWDLTFELNGYVAGKASCDVDQDGRSRPVRVTLKKAFDPNAFIQEEGKKAAALTNQKKFAEARAVYESIGARVPEVSPQMQQFVAQTYYLEGNAAKAAEIQKAVLARNPNDTDVKLRLIGYLVEAGSTDEAAPILKTVEDAKITSAAPYADFGLALMKKQRSADALPYLDKAIARFPQSPEPYYYRANALADLVNAQKDNPKDPVRLERIAKIKADLTKFLELAPTSPAAEDAKKLLEQVEKMLVQK